MKKTEVFARRKRGGKLAEGLDVPDGLNALSFEELRESNIIVQL